MAMTSHMTWNCSSTAVKASKLKKHLMCYTVTPAPVQTITLHKLPLSIIKICKQGLWRQAFNTLLIFSTSSQGNNSIHTMLQSGLEFNSLKSCLLHFFHSPI
jgi:hypothetical protein